MVNECNAKLLKSNEMGICSQICLAHNKQKSAFHKSYSFPAAKDAQKPKRVLLRSNEDS